MGGTYSEGTTNTARVIGQESVLPVHLQVHVRINRDQITYRSAWSDQHRYRQRLKHAWLPPAPRPPSSPRARFKTTPLPMPIFCGSPLYSMPHFNFAITGLPVRSFRKGFGLTGTCGASALVVNVLGVAVHQIAPGFEAATSTVAMPSTQRTSHVWRIRADPLRSHM